MRELKDAYFAGLFDGEGSVGVYACGNGKNGSIAVFWGIKLAICGTCYPAIAAIYDNFKVGQVSTAKRNKGHHLGTKPQWVWSVSSRADALSVLKRLLPFSIEKKEQIKVAIKFCNREMNGDESSIMMKNLKQAIYPHSIGQNARKERIGMNSDSCPTSRTTFAIAEEIREKHTNGKKQCDLVLEYGLSKSMINRIVLNKTYTHSPRLPFLQNPV